MGRHRIPRNIEAEQALLGSLMLSPKSFVEIMDIIDVDSFYSAKNQAVFKCIKDLFINGEPVDTITVMEKANELDLLGSSIQASYLSQIASETPNSSGAMKYAKIVQDKALRRNMMDIADVLSSNSQEDDNDTIEVTSDAISKLANGLIVSSKSSTVAEALKDMDTRIQAYIDSGSKYIGVEMDMSDLDKYLEGMQDGHLGVITGYTSAGKTAISLNIMASYIKQGKKVVMFSLEMSPEQLMSRLIGIIANIPIWKIRKGMMNELELSHAKTAREFITKSGSKVYSDSNWANIQMTMLKESVDKQTSLFILDYIQLVSVSGMNDYAGLKHVSKELQTQLQRFNIPMVCLSQISNENAKEDRPDIISTKGAGDIAASADWVIRLKNKEDQDTVNEFKSNDVPLPISVYIQKNRHGGTGKCMLYFHTNTNKFYGTDNYDEQKYRETIEMIKGSQNQDVLDDKLRRF